MTGKDQRVAVITGGSQGIGAGLVAGYRRLGWAVVANARAIKPSKDPDVLAVEGDISQPATADRITGDALARFGRIDTLVNNAGVFVSKPFTGDTAQDHALIGRRQPHRVLLADPARHRRDAEAERRPCRQPQRHPGR